MFLTYTRPTGGENPEEQRRRQGPQGTARKGLTTSPLPQARTLGNMEAAEINALTTHPHSPILPQQHAEWLEASENITFHLSAAVPTRHALSVLFASYSYLISTLVDVSCSVCTSIRV